jgi:glutamyl-tRNA synthetase
VVITRFAPSPTGVLHLGSARTALFNWLYAKGRGGKFLLRIEDTDQARSNDAFTQSILSSLRWLGLPWDGEPIFQLARQQRHQKVAFGLLEKGLAYKCYCSPERLQNLRDQAMANGQQPRYDRKCRDHTENQNSPFVIRLKAPLEGQTTVQDEVQGTVTLENSTLDDMVLLRADQSPTYMLAVVVDDHDMHISHIIRGSDHFTNTFRQKLLYEALGWTLPGTAHIPLIHGQDGAKLSKRHGAVNVESFKDQGILPQAMQNALLRLGWAHGDEEKISLNKALEWFDFGGLSASPARFDEKKLWALNEYYLRQLSAQEVLQLLDLHPQAVLEKALQILPELQLRASTLVDLKESLLLYVIPERPPLCNKIKALLTPEIQETLKAFTEECLRDDTPLNEDGLRRWATEKGLPLGQIAKALRMALLGQTVSPGIFQVTQILGPQWIKQRIHQTWEELTRTV